MGRSRAGQAVAERLQHRTGPRHLPLPHQQVQVDHGPLGRIVIDRAGQRAALEDDNVYPLLAQGGDHLRQIGAQPLVAQQVGIVGTLEAGQHLRRDPTRFQPAQPLVEQGQHAVAPGGGQQRRPVDPLLEERLDAGPGLRIKIAPGAEKQ